MIVCSCFGITDKDIEKGLYGNMGAGCGSCLIPPKPEFPRMRIEHESFFFLGWLCNKKTHDDENGCGCRKRKDHKGSCKRHLSFWEKVKREFISV